MFTSVAHHKIEDEINCQCEDNLYFRFTWKTIPDWTVFAFRKQSPLVYWETTQQNWSSWVPCEFEHKNCQHSATSN